MALSRKTITRRNKSLKKVKFEPLDPRQIYVERAKHRSQNASGLESLAYKILGYETIGSFALALDPLSSLRDPRQRSQKTRTRTSSSLTYDRSWRTVTTSTTVDVPAFTSQPVKYGGPTVVQRSGNPSGFKLVSRFMTDTTDKTRNTWETGGILESFEPTVKFSCTAPWYSTYILSYGFRQSSSRVDTSYYSVMNGPFAVLSTGTQDQLVQKESELADIALSANVNKLLARSLPTSPSFGLLHFFGELRDIRHFRNLADLPTKLRDRVLNARDAGGVELSYEFGLKPLYSDVLSLLALPDRVARRLNYLVSRNGKETTYRQRTTLPVAPFGETPSWDVTGMIPHGFTLSNSSDEAFRTAEIRSSVKATLEFPKVQLPEFRRRLYASLIGARPNAKVLYELTPWSWLIDWFSGVGDYIQVMDNINLDPSLINDGWITYESKVRLVNHSTITKTVQSSFNPKGIAPTIYYPQTVDAGQHTEYSYVYKKRRHMSELGVKTVSGLSNLSDYQLKILSALFAQRT